jgi:hypothetical protein
MMMKRQATCRETLSSIYHHHDGDTRTRQAQPTARFAAVHEVNWLVYTVCSPSFTDWAGMADGTREFSRFWC